MNELILIVDDEPGILKEISNILQDEGYRTLTTDSGRQAIELFHQHRPAVVFLDIWLPDRDGLEVLQAIKAEDDGAVVIMMSGHGTAPTAVQSIKMGALDYLEKPLAYERIVEAVNAALGHSDPAAVTPSLDAEKAQIESGQFLAVRPDLPIVRRGDLPQRTIKNAAVIYGLGLHSGRRTGMVLQPLPVDSGVHFLTLPKRTSIPAHISAVGDTEYATTLSHGGEDVRTVEHFLGALHAFGITNLLIKVHGEIPVLDGSALEFCSHIQDIGIVDQDARRQELVIDRTYEVRGKGEKALTIEPAEVFSISYLLRYPVPIGEQFFEFALTSPQVFVDEIAPARTFGFMRDLKMMNELGLGSGGRLDNCILVGEDNVINTVLRFPDEFVRHKILDIIGDLYLLGYPVRGKVTARLTGHRDNITLQRAILAAHA